MPQRELRAARPLESARRALEPAGQASELDRRALEPPGRASELAGRASVPAGRVLDPTCKYMEMKTKKE